MVASSMTVREVASTIQISERAVCRWLAKQRQGQLLEPSHLPDRTQAIGADDEPQLVQQVDTHPDATLAEHCAASSLVSVSLTAMSHTLRRSDISVKNKR